MGRSGGPDGRELSAMLALVDDGLHDEPGPPMPWALLEGIGRLVGNDAITFCELDFRDLTNPVQQDVTGEVRSLDYDRGGPDVATYFRHQHGFLPCAPDRVVPGPVSWADFYSRRQLHSTPAYCEYFRPLEPGVTRAAVPDAGHARPRRDRHRRVPTQLSCGPIINSW